MPSSIYIHFLAIILLFSQCHLSLSGQAIKCNREFNTHIFAPNFTADVPVNCVDTWYGEYTCASSSCKNLDRGDGQLHFEGCWEFPVKNRVHDIPIRSYKIHRDCAKIELSPAPYLSPPRRPSWWCHFNLTSGYNDDRMTCGNCQYNRTLTPSPENCASLPK
ncbi:hypothetical protein O181_047814 [Austropuccinia psidii MF-1]|uniref:Secreted protein n=1 Tax=Austropuccinia psidii MF-1 TaxID=1389203 RepID=A0A9Q3DRK7_9BASI|nr:hypothetical protein [Austropuccinia psidii MF-1]